MATIDKISFDTKRVVGYLIVTLDFLITLYFEGADEGSLP
jgi:hypothetical protein